MGFWPQVIVALGHCMQRAAGPRQISIGQSVLHKTQCVVALGCQAQSIAWPRVVSVFHIGPPQVILLTQFSVVYVGPS